MRQFNVEIVLPSGKKYRVKELNNKDYLIIIKYTQNNDLIGLSRLFEELFIEPDMNIFDRFYLLIFIRMIYIEDSITLNVENKNIDVNLNSILEKLETNYVDLETKFEEGGIEIALDLPCISYYEHIDDLYISTIKTIKVADNVLEFSTLSKHEQSQVMDNLPASLFKRINKFIQTIQNNLLDISLIEQNKDIGVEELKINILGNGVMQFISNLFSTNLKSFYSLIYLFQNTITPGSDLFFKLSPVESRILMNIHSERVATENKKLQNQNER